MKRLTPANVTLMMLITVFSLVAAYIAKNLRATEAPPPVERRSVPMALSSLEPGTVITEAHLGEGRVPETELQPEMLLDESGIVGRVVKQPIPAARPIRASQLYQPGERPPLEIEEGMRAVSVSVPDGVALVDGLIRPGQSVDVHLTPSRPVRGDGSGGLTLTLLEGVRVVALNRGQAATSVNRTDNSVTLELTPKQANILILARDRGEITLSYNPGGAGESSVGLSGQGRATLEQILGLKPPPQPEPPFVVESYRGASRSTLEFRNGRRVGEQEPEQRQQGSRGRAKPADGDPQEPNSSTTTDSGDGSP